MKTKIKKWEYGVVSFCGNSKDLGELLDNWGEHGWELASIVGEGNQLLIFKRQK